MCDTHCVCIKALRMVVLEYCTVPMSGAGVIQYIWCLVVVSGADAI